MTIEQAARVLFSYEETIEFGGKTGDMLKLDSYKQWSIGEISRRFYDEVIREPYVDDRLSAIDIVDNFISDLEFFISISTRKDNRLLFSTAKNAAEGFLKYVLDMKGNSNE